MFVVEAVSIRAAYYKAVKRVREETDNLVRLNYCKRVDD